MNETNITQDRAALKAWLAELEYGSEIAVMEGRRLLYIGKVITSRPGYVSASGQTRFSRATGLETGTKSFVRRHIAEPTDELRAVQADRDERARLTARLRAARWDECDTNTLRDAVAALDARNENKAAGEQSADGTD